MKNKIKKGSKLKSAVKKLKSRKQKLEKKESGLLENPFISKSSEKKRVLLVEDDPLVSKAYAYFIQKAGYIVDVALNVLEARKRTAAHRPHIILLDIIMPGVNGFEYLKELKKSPKLSDVPVIMTSNLGEESAITRCKRLGAADYFVKSNAFMRDVINRIDTLIRQTRYQ